MDLYKIAVCKGPSCSSRFSQDIKKKFSEIVSKKSLGKDIIVGDGGCYGRCIDGPNVMVIGPIPRDEEENYRSFSVPVKPDLRRQLYNGVSVNDCLEIIDTHCVKGQILERLADKR